MKYSIKTILAALLFGTLVHSGVCHAEAGHPKAVKPDRKEAQHDKKAQGANSQESQDNRKQHKDEIKKLRKECKAGNKTSCDEAKKKTQAMKQELDADSQADSK